MVIVAIILGRQGTLEKHAVAICLAFCSYSSFYAPWPQIIANCYRLVIFSNSIIQTLASSAIRQ